MSAGYSVSTCCYRRAALQEVWLTKGNTHICLVLLSTSSTVQDLAHIFPQPEISKQLSSPRDQQCAVSLFDPGQICAFYTDKSGFVHEGAA